MNSGTSKADKTASIQSNIAANGNTRGRTRAFAVFFLVTLLAAGGGLLWWLHARQFEDTDDAQVDAHLNSIIRA